MTAANDRPELICGKCGSSRPDARLQKEWEAMKAFEEKLKRMCEE